MARLICNFTDVLGKAVNGSVTISSGEPRPGHATTSVILPAQREAAVQNGTAIFDNVNPGRIVISVDWTGQSVTFRTVVPDVASVTLSECLDTSFHPPSEVDSLKRMIEQIRGLQDVFTRLKSEAEHAAEQAERSYVSTQYAASSAAESLPSAAQRYVEHFGDAFASRMQQLAQTLEAAKQEAAASGRTAAKSYLDSLFQSLPTAFDTMQEIVAELQSNQSARASLTNAIAGKADKSHTHTLAQLTDAPDSHTSFTTANTLMSRDSSGRARVNNPVNSYDIANKTYVDGLVAKKAEKAHRHAATDVDGLTTALSGKADKTHTHTLAQITDAPNSHTASGNANTLMSRDGAGRSKVASPLVPTEIANKGYVDARVPEIKIVSQLPSSPVAGVVYVVTG